MAKGKKATAPYTKHMVAVLFAQVAEEVYSGLSEDELTTFAQDVIPQIAKILHIRKPAYLNHWFGKDYVAAFTDPLSAARTALELQDYFANTNWKAHHLPENLRMKIALHVGVIMIGSDPIRGGDGLVGTQINLTARIPPVATVGEVWGTRTFVEMLAQCGDSTIASDPLGELDLDKKWGKELLSKIHRKSAG